MRPIGEQRSSLRYPLDEILGSEANVRLLRILLEESPSALSVTDAAESTGLTREGARKALERLAGSGIVERVGSGRAQKWGIKSSHTLVPALRAIFDAERQRHDRFITGLRESVSLPEVRTAWTSIPPTGSREPVLVHTETSAAAVLWIQEELRARVAGLEREFDVIIEFEIHAGADAPIAGADTVPLWGLIPGAAIAMETPPRTHAETERRSLVMAQGIAEILRRDPSLITRAKQHLDRLLAEGAGTASADLAEWRQLLDVYSAERVRDMLVSTSSRAERLRQSSPFFAVLTPPERDRVLAGLETKR